MSDFYIASFSLDGDSLCHYGVKGMHWGVRRYVNKDGSYTDLGRKKYGGEKAKKYKEAELSAASKKLNKSLRKGDKIKANKHMKQIQALNKMTEDDVINERLGIVQAANKASLAGAVGATIAAPIVVSKTRKERADHFVNDYKDMTLEELEKIFKNM